MKGASNGWDRLLSLAERLPLARHLPEGPRRGAAYGIWAGGLLMFVVGALLGGVNRGAAGLVIAAISGACLGMILGGGLGSLFGALFTAPTARATVSIEFDGGKKTFRPGETLSGAVELHAQSGFKCGGRACFMCRGHYAHNRARPDRTAAPEFVRESRQYLLQQEQVIPAGRMRQGSRARYPFSFTVPSDAIPTHHGYACSVRWTVNALIDAITESPLEAREEVFVESVAQPAPSPQGGYESRAEAEHCQVTLALPRAICAEGDTLHGHIVVVPKNSFDSPQIRALLLRIEHNPKGDGDIVYVGQWDAKTGQFQGERRRGGEGSTYVWLEDEQVVAGSVRFESAEPRSWFFKLDIPMQWRPTFETKDGQVNWKVGVMVAGQDYPDVRAFHEVIVHTTQIELPQPEPGME